MSIECSYKDINFCRTSLRKLDECLCDTNMIVPDSMGDIASIISIKAYPSVSDTKTESGRIIVTGQVKINVLYIAEEENSTVCSLSSSVPYSHVITAPEATEEHISMVSIVSSSSNHSIVNSRRLKVTTLLRFCAVSYRNNRIKVLSEVSGAEVKTSNLTIASACVICRKNIAVSATSDIPAGKSPITKILRRNTKISDYDFKTLNNKVIIKGNLLAHILYLAGDNITDCTVTIPFTEVAEAEGLSPSLDTQVKLRVADCEINPDTDLSGEYKMLDSTIVLEATILAFTRTDLTAVSDIYLPGGALKTESIAVSVQSFTPPAKEEEFIKETVTLPETMPAISRIVDADCSLTDFSLSEGSASATAEVNVMYMSDDSKNRLQSFTAKIPIIHNFTIKNPVNPESEVKHISYAITGPYSIELRFGVDFSASSDSFQSLSVYTSCEETDFSAPKRPSIIVSFVNSGDTLWSIAKKHNIPLSRLASANALDENAILTVGEKLIIPR